MGFGNSTVKLLQDTARALAAVMVLLVVYSTKTVAQENLSPRAAGDSIRAIVQQMSVIRDDSTVLALNSQLRKTLRETMIDNPGREPDIQDIRSIVRAKSDDGLVVFYHWNLQMSTGHFRYNGFLATMLQGQQRLYELTDRSDSVPGQDSALLSPQSWIGALYYRIITGVGRDGKKIYTLLGWSGQDRKLTRKVIEILSFDESGYPIFGAPVFSGYGHRSRTRIIFRYDATSSMSLKYEEQPVKVTRKWNAATRTFDEKLELRNIIVFDRLLPLDPLLEGQFQYYVPSGDQYDGFAFEKGYWVFLESVDARNLYRQP